MLQRIYNNVYVNNLSIQSKCMQTNTQNDTFFLLICLIVKKSVTESFVRYQNDYMYQANMVILNVKMSFVIDKHIQPPVTLQLCTVHRAHKLRNKDIYLHIKDICLYISSKSLLMYKQILATLDILNITS